MSNPSTKPSWAASKPAGGDDASPSQFSWVMGTGTSPTDPIPTTANENGGSDDGVMDVIIVGAGLSGLTCADRILELNPGVKVLILEGADRVGGRTKTIDLELEEGIDLDVGNDPEANRTRRKLRVDAGGMWLGPTQTNMLKLCERFKVETVPQFYNEGKHVLARGTKQSRAAYRGDIPPYSYLSLIEIQFMVLSRVDSLMSYVPLDAPEQCPYAKEWDSISVGAFFTKSAWTSGTKEVIELVCWSLLGCQATQVSLLFFLWFVRSCEGLKMLTDATGGAQDRRMVGGAQQISERMLEAIEGGGGKIVFNATVHRIEQDLDNVVAIVTTASGQSYRSKTVVSAGCASKFLLKCTFNPPLPRMVQRFADCTLRGAYAKAIVAYKTAWWRTAGYSGFFTNTKPGVDACVAFGYDYGPEPALVCFIAGDVCEKVCDLSEHDREQSVLNSLALLFPDHDVRKDVVGYHDEFWQTNQFSGGCPLTVYPPGFFAEYSAARLLTKPFATFSDASPLLFFAGTDVSNKWVGYMEGAVIRGKEVAEQVVQVLKTKEGKPTHVVPSTERRWVPVNMQ